MFIQIVPIPETLEEKTIFITMSTSEHHDWIEQPLSTYTNLNSYLSDIYQTQPGCDLENAAMVREFAILEHLHHKFTCISTVEDFSNKMCSCGFRSNFNIKILHQIDDDLTSHKQQQQTLQEEEKQQQQTQKHQQNQQNDIKLYLNHPKMFTIDEIINTVLNHSISK